MEGIREALKRMEAFMKDLKAEKKRSSAKKK